MSAGGTVSEDALPGIGRIRYQKGDDFSLAAGSNTEITLHKSQREITVHPPSSRVSSNSGLNVTERGGRCLKTIPNQRAGDSFPCGVAKCDAVANLSWRSSTSPPQDSPAARRRAYQREPCLLLRDSPCGGSAPRIPHRPESLRGLFANLSSCGDGFPSRFGRGALATALATPSRPWRRFADSPFQPAKRMF